MCSLQTRGRSFLANACFHTVLEHALGWCACLGGFSRSHNSTGVVLQLLPVGALTECGLVALTDLAKFFGDGHGYEIGRQTFGSPTSEAWHCSVGPVRIRLYSQCFAYSAEQHNCRHGA